MKPSFCLLALCLLCCFNACQPFSETGAPPSLRQGWLYAQHDGLYFRDCADGRIHPLLEPSPDLIRRYDAIRSFTHQPVLARLELRPAADSALHFVAAHSLRRRTLETDCFSFAARALGQEPFWSLELFTDGFALLTDVSNERCTLLTIEETITRTDSIEYRLLGLPGQQPVLNLTARFQNQACTDPMSGRQFPWSVSVHFDQRTLHGCAEVFPPGD